MINWTSKDAKKLNALLDIPHEKRDYKQKMEVSALFIKFDAYLEEQDALSWKNSQIAMA